MTVFAHDPRQGREWPKIGHILNKSSLHHRVDQNGDQCDEKDCTQPDRGQQPVGLFGRNRWRIRNARPDAGGVLQQHAHANHERLADALRAADRAAIHGAISTFRCVPDVTVHEDTSETLPRGAVTLWQGFAMQWSRLFHHSTIGSKDNGSINDASADLIWGPGRLSNSVLSKDQNDEEDCTCRRPDHHIVCLSGIRRRRIRRPNGHIVRQLRQRPYGHHERPADALRPTARRALHCAVVRFAHQTTSFVNDRSATARGPVVCGLGGS